MWEWEALCMGVGGTMCGRGRYRVWKWEVWCVGTGARGTLHGSRRHSAWEQDREMGRL